MFGDILKELRLGKNLTQQQLADSIGLSKSAISMYENGKRVPELEILELFADFFNVDMNRLTGSKFSSGISNILPMPDMIRIPLLGAIACGEPILAQENLSEYVDLPKHIHADFALECKGDSMIDAHIYDGDIVYINSHSEIENGQIVVALIENGATLKRMYKTNDTLILQPENKSYSPIVLHGAELEQVRILGRAVAFTSLVK